MSQTVESPAPKRRRRRWIVAAVCAVAVGYVAYDVYGPRRSDLRSFDLDEVARLETAMWRSYYSRERAKLFFEMAELLRTQYHLPWVRSNVVAYEAARAAFVFKDGHDRGEYVRALPILVDYYASLQRVSVTPFDVDEAARLELEWWIVHRERKNHAPGDLANALAVLPAAIYHVPADALAEHARLRAEAMTIRDTKAEEGGVTEEDWARIDELLHRSWRNLHDAVSR